MVIVQVQIHPAVETGPGRPVVQSNKIIENKISLNAEALGGVALETETLYGIETLREDAQGPATLILDADWAAQAPALKEAAPQLRILVLAEPRTKDRFTRKDLQLLRDLADPDRLSRLNRCYNLCALKSAGYFEAQIPFKVPIRGRGAGPLHAMRLCVADDVEEGLASGRILSLIHI